MIQQDKDFNLIPYFNNTEETLKKVYDIYGIDFNLNNKSIQDLNRILDQLMDFLNTSFVVVSYSLHKLINDYLGKEIQNIGYSVNYYPAHKENSNPNKGRSTFVCEGNNERSIEYRAYIFLPDDESHHNDDLLNEINDVKNLLELKNVIRKNLSTRHGYIPLLNKFYDSDAHYRQLSIKNPSECLPPFSIREFFKLQNKITEVCFEANEFKDGKYTLESFLDKYDCSYKQKFNLDSYRTYLTREVFENEVPQPYYQYCISANDYYTKDTRGNLVFYTDQKFDLDGELIKVIKVFISHFFSTLTELEFRFVNEKKSKEIYYSQLKAAIISILIDSYAHNISAHSLAALKWWIESRHKMMDKRIKFDDQKVEIKGLSPQNITSEERIPDMDEKGIIKRDDKNNYIFKAGDPLYETTQKYYQALGLTDSTYNASFYSLFDYLQFANKSEVEKLFMFDGKVSQNSNKKYDFNPRFPVPIDYALYPFFRFLRDKGAFWSGVTRDVAFGGEYKTWYKILWEDFANNPLYLGTIDKSEGITKININLYVDICGVKHRGRFITIDMSLIDYEEEISRDPYLNSFKYSDKLNEESDLGDCSDCNCKYVDAKYYSKYAFIKLGKCFESFRLILNNEDNCKVFLPGGIVGEHALFTIFENTIRNIKHYKDLDSIKKKGLDFWISIELEKLKTSTGPTLISTNKDPNYISNNVSDLLINHEKDHLELFKVGVWLQHKTEIVSEKRIYGELIMKNEECDERGMLEISSRAGNKIKAKFIKDEELKVQERGKQDHEEFEISSVNNHIIESINSNLLIKLEETPEPQNLLLNITRQSFKPILDEQTGAPRMGGNSQDKACAAMLFNNRFGHVETIQKPRDQEYFPWIRFQIQNDDASIMEIKQQCCEERKIIDEDLFYKAFSPKIKAGDKGILKKFFYLWRGEEVLDKAVLLSDDWENPARAKFLVSNNAWNLDETIKARKNGIIRLLCNSKKEDEVNELYKKWLNSWLTLNFDDPDKVIIGFVHGNKGSIKEGKEGFLGKIGANNSGAIRVTNSFLSFYYATSDKGQGKDDPYEKANANILLSHGAEENHNINVRSHGVFFQKFFSGGAIDKLNKCKMCVDEQGNVKKDKKELLYEDKLLCELTESILTKIVVFDNRVFDRFKLYHKDKIAALRRQLFLEVYKESIEEWNEYTKSISGIVNFLVIHLSFIESLGYKEDRIEQFIEKQLKPKFPNIKNGNFIFVVTSGRGRDAWRESINNKLYKSFTIFKPIESILNSIESGISYNDHFDIKHNLSKVLFGS